MHAYNKLGKIAKYNTAVEPVKHIKSVKYATKELVACLVGTLDLEREVLSSNPAHGIFYPMLFLQFSPFGCFNPLNLNHVSFF